MLALIPQLPEWAPYVACTIYVAAEYWLGRTDKVQSGSALELLLNTLKTICGAGKPKG